MEPIDPNKEIVVDQAPIVQMPDLVKSNPNLDESKGAVSPNLKPFQSSNFKANSAGWRTKPGGDAEFNGGRIVSTHFTPVFKAKGLTFYVSDGTTPNANLSGNAGDVCFGADSGKAYKCTSTTTWVAF